MNKNKYKAGRTNIRHLRKSGEHFTYRITRWNNIGKARNSLVQALFADADANADTLHFDSRVYFSGEVVAVKEKEFPPVLAFMLAKHDQEFGEPEFPVGRFYWVVSVPVTKKRVRVFRYEPSEIDWQIHYLWCDIDAMVTNQYEIETLDLAHLTAEMDSKGQWHSFTGESK